MRSQRDRDAVTLVISTTLLIFAVVAAVGTGLVVLVDRLLGDTVLPQGLTAVVLACATVTALAYVWRHRRP